MNNKTTEWTFWLFSAEIWDSSPQAAQLPKNPRDQEVKTALDLGAVDEAVYVAGVHGLSVFSTCSFTHYRDDGIISSDDWRISSVKVHGEHLFVLTFRAESIAALTLPLAFFFHLHLVWRTDAHAGATAHHKILCKEKEKQDRWGISDR